MKIPPSSSPPQSNSIERILLHNRDRSDQPSSLAIRNELNKILSKINEIQFSNQGYGKRPQLKMGGGRVASLMFK